jgi:hypothetical protein
MFFFIVLFFALCAKGQVGDENPQRSRRNPLMFMPPGYREEALGLVTAEANVVANQLHLAEQLPITESNLLAAYIPPPRLAARLSAIGNITTSNYTYFFSVGRKFSFVTKNGFDHEYSQLRQQYLWPTNRMDTNAAYQLAEQWLSDVSMDVKALDRDCNVHIDAYTPEGGGGQNFVTVYWVYWVKGGEEGHGSVATVELLGPTKTIRQLRVERPEYILRKPLEITNLEALLSQTNELKTGTGPAKTSR